jgi:5-methylcytosine-specific restriction endonuclease McrA
MALITLKPRLKAIGVNRLPVLEHKARQDDRPRGRKWMETRNRVALAHGYRCAECGCAWVKHRDMIDHTIPRWKGGSDEDHNLRPLCDVCHAAKTKAEAAEKARLAR